MVVERLCAALLVSVGFLDDDAGERPFRGRFNLPWLGRR
jgi:hypothetical protein